MRSRVDKAAGLDEDSELERAVRFELTLTGFAVQRLWPAWRRARLWPQVTHIKKRQITEHILSPSIRADLRKSAAEFFLERKERFELSRRVWKTRMFPATSLPRVIAICQFPIVSELPNRFFNRQSAIGNRQYSWGSR